MSKYLGKLRVVSIPPRGRSKVCVYRYKLGMLLLYMFWGSMILM